MNPTQFLKELKAHDAEQYKIVTTLRDLILKDKGTSEEIKYGGLLYSLKKPYTGLFVSKNHVSMEFSNGALFTDPENLLQGSGKSRRHLKFTDTKDISKPHVSKFLKQARTVA